MSVYDFRCVVDRLNAGVWGAGSNFRQSLPMTPPKLTYCLRASPQACSAELNEARAVMTYPPCRELAWLTRRPILKDVVNAILRPEIQRFRWPARRRNDNATAARLAVDRTTAHLADFLRDFLSNSLDVPMPEITDSIHKVMEEVTEPRFTGGVREYEHAKRACRQATPVHAHSGGQPVG